MGTFERAKIYLNETRLYFKNEEGRCYRVDLPVRDMNEMNHKLEWFEVNCESTSQTQLVEVPESEIGEAAKELVVKLVDDKPKEQLDEYGRVIEPPLGRCDCCDRAFTEVDPVVHLQGTMYVTEGGQRKAYLTEHSDLCAKCTNGSLGEETVGGMLANGSLRGSYRYLVTELAPPAVEPAAAAALAASENA